MTIKLNNNALYINYPNKLDKSFKVDKIFKMVAVPTRSRHGRKFDHYEWNWTWRFNTDYTTIKLNNNALYINYPNKLKNACSLNMAYCMKSDLALNMV